MAVPGATQGSWSKSRVLDPMDTPSNPPIQTAFLEISARAAAERQAHAALQVIHRVDIMADAVRSRSRRLDTADSRARAVPGEAAGPESRGDAIRRCKDQGVGSRTLSVGHDCYR